MPSTVSNGFCVTPSYDRTPEDLHHGLQRLLLRVVRLFALEAREGPGQEQLQRDQQLRRPHARQQLAHAVELLVVEAQRSEHFEEVPRGREEALGGLFVDLLGGGLFLAVGVLGLYLHVSVLRLQVRGADELLVEVVVLEEEVQTEDLEVLLHAVDQHELGFLVDFVYLVE